MPFWHRLVIAGVVFLLVSLVARFVDWRLSRKPHPPGLVTRYIVLRRSPSAGILIVGLFSALLVIPQVRAGILIALTQSVRLGDRIEWAGSEGVVEEIGLTYTFVRMQDDARIVIPNEKPPPIRSATPRSAAARRWPKSRCRSRSALMSARSE
jgi:small-conductance mechanosensitive channel